MREFLLKLGDVPVTVVQDDDGSFVLPERLRGQGGTALKPAWEPIVLARKPIDGSVAENIARWGVGPIAIDACRVGPIGAQRKILNGSGDGPSATAYGDGLNGSHGEKLDGVGRWPANLILDEEAGAMLDEQSGQRTSGVYTGHRNLPKTKTTFGAFSLADEDPASYGDSGGASRFFFCPKVSTFEREFGCEGLPERDTTETVQREPGSKGTQSPRAGGQRNAGAPLFHCSECGANISSSGGIAGSPCIDGGEHTPVQVGIGPKVRNHHVSLKPIALIKYLATLIKPPMGGRLLVPYSGAGSEMIGAMRAGWTDIVGLERDAEYVAIAEARLKRWAEVPAHVDPLVTKPEPKLAAQGALF